VSDVQQTWVMAGFRVLFVIASVFGATGAEASDTGHWNCPASESAKDNPIASAPSSVARGKQLARASCVDCHGEHWRGNGPASAKMNPRPADWRDRTFQTQSDGCIYWKISTGRGVMPAAGRMPEADRWHIINFIRSLDPRQ